MRSWFSSLLRGGTFVSSCVDDRVSALKTSTTARDEGTRTVGGDQVPGHATPHGKAHPHMEYRATTLPGDKRGEPISLQYATQSLTESYVVKHFVI